MPQLLASGRGPVVNIASTYGALGAPLPLAHCATKGAIVILTRQVAVDSSGQGVRVNAICPGYIATDHDGHRAAMDPDAAA